ncbi:hypothetical protein GIB67_016720 [Kingdonia uniflora]|uniref:Uncharacterized protein n=1 Tax=Kingdonia uniflora TaxID=39325 RepID=A0A7J7LMK8_9MAGN|nr:hypothetical protein GIB67_016720 [Kingdonia uniflora]
MVKTRSQRAVEARVLNDLHLAFKIDAIREAIFGQQGYDTVLLKTRVNYEGKTDEERGEEMNRVYWSESMRTCWRSVKDCKKLVLMMTREEIINEDMDIASGLPKACGVVGNTGCFKCNRPRRAVTPVIGVGDKEDTVAELIEWPHLKGSRVEYPIGSCRFKEFYKAKSSIDGNWGHAFAYRAQFDYGLTLALSNLAKSVMNLIGAYPAQLNCNFWEVILVCETLNGRWAASGSEGRIIAKDFLEYYPVKYVTATDSAYLSSSSSRPCFFDLSSAGRVWNDNLLWVSCECLQRSDEEPLKLNNRTITKVSRKESFIDVVAREGTELEAILKELEISRFKMVASKNNKVRRSQAKRRLAGKTPGSMEEKLSTPELNTPLKLARLNEILDGPVDMATVSSTVVRNLAKRMAVKRGATPRSVTSVSVDDSSKRRKATSPTKLQEVLEESDKITEGAELWPRFEVEAGLLEEQCQAKAREKMVVVMDDEFKKFARALRDVQLGFQDRSMELEKRISQLEGEKNQLEENLTRERGAFQLEREKEREAAALKLKEVRAESEAEAERLVTASAISRNNLAGKLYQLRYTKAEIMTFNKGNYKEMEIMDEEEVEEREDGLNVAKRTAADNQETIKQEIESSLLRVVALEGLLEVEKNPLLNCRIFVYVPSVLRPKLVIVGRARRNWLSRACRCLYCKLISMLLSICLSIRDLALNQLTSKLAELKEKVTSGSRHESELAEYRIRALNEEISDMKYNLRALKE